MSDNHDAGSFFGKTLEQSQPLIKSYIEVKVPLERTITKVARPIVPKNMGDVASLKVAWQCVACVPKLTLVDTASQTS